MPDDYAITASNISKGYRGVTVLAGVDLQVRRGTVFALLGPNGAGKTTLVRIVSTLLTPDGGTAQVLGRDVVVDRAQVRRVISLTGQFAAVDELLTGAENMRLMGRLSHLGRAQSRSRAARLLEQFDLADAQDRAVRTYSGGMRRRLDLAMSLIGRPSVIFLDEPTTGLDPRSRQAMWAEVRRLAGTGVTVFLTTQHLEEADELANHIAVLDGGRVVAEGTPDELKRRVAGQRLDLQLPDNAMFQAASRVLGDRATYLDPALHTVGIPTEARASEVTSLLAEMATQGVTVDKVALHKTSLDEVFMALTGRPQHTVVMEEVHG